MTDNNRLSVIEKLEKTSESLKAAASSMRHELLAGGVDVEKVKEVLRHTDWKWQQGVCLRVAGYPSYQSGALITEWMEVPEIQEPLKNILQCGYLSNVRGNITLSKEFPSPKVEVYLGGGTYIACRIEFADLKELKNAIYDGTVRADGLLKQLDVLAKSNETHREELAQQIQESREQAETIEAEKADIERLAEGPPLDYQESFEQKWGDLAEYNSRNNADCSPEFKVKMLRKQAAYNRLQARGFDVVTERPTGESIPVDHKPLLDIADRMEKEAAEILVALAS